jgi:hypothetical protein
MAAEVPVAASLETRLRSETIGHETEYNSRRRHGMLKNVMKVGVAAFAVVVVGVLAVGLTADEILDRMDVEADVVAEGSLVSTIRFENAYADGTTASNLFGSLSKPKLSLIYFIEPEDVQGTIFLTQEAETDGADAHIFLYLPLLGIPKELVSDEERGGSFAGSSLSYEDLGGRDGREDYDAVVLREEEFVIGDLTRTAYVVESTAKPGVDSDTPRTVLWIDTEFFIMLKVESYNDLGNLDSTMEILGLVEFEGRLTADGMLATDVSNESSTTITFLDRHRPDAEIPDGIFSPESLKTFDPTAWGF